MSVPCPRCRVYASALLSDGRLRCIGCSHVYEAMLPWPPLPPATPRMASRGGAAGLLILVATIGVMFGLMVLYFSLAG
jgi:hypothetical protein